MNDTLTTSAAPAGAAKKAVNYLPAAYHTVTPYLIIEGAAKAIDFYKSVFGASELMRMPGPEGKIMHAEIRIGNSPVMMSDGTPAMEFRSPSALGGSSVGLLVYVEDVDACVARAVAAGAKVIKPAQDQFYGDRSGTIVDPFGHLWTVSTHIEDVSPEEMQRRLANMKCSEQG